MVYYCSIKDDCNLTQSETIQSQKDQPLRLDLNGLDAFIEDSQTTGYKKEEKAKWREESKSISLFLSRERELSLPVYHHQKKKMNFLSFGREKVCFWQNTYLYTNFVLFRKRLWCFCVRPFVVPFFYGGFGATFRSRHKTTCFTLLAHFTTSYCPFLLLLREEEEVVELITKLYYEYGFLIS